MRATAWPAAPWPDCRRRHTRHPADAPRRGLLGQMGVDGVGHGAIRHCRDRCFHIDDQVRASSSQVSSDGPCSRPIPACASGYSALRGHRAIESSASPGAGCPPHANGSPDPHGSTAGATPAAGPPPRQLPQLRGRAGRIDGLQQVITIRPDTFRQRLPLLLALGQTKLLEAMAVAIKPSLRDLLHQPGGRRLRQDLQPCRRVSPTNSSRFSDRTAAKTCVESLRWRPRPRSRPSSRKRRNMASSSCCSAWPCRSRSRNSLRASNRSSRVNSNPSTYFQSMRVATASAACRSVSPSANCMIVTNPAATALPPCRAG